MLGVAMAAISCGRADGLGSRDPGAASLAEVRLSGVRVAEQWTWRAEDAGGERLEQVRRWSVRVRGEVQSWETSWQARVDGEGRLADVAVVRDGVLVPWEAPDEPVVLLEEAAPTLRRAAGGETLTVRAWLPTSGLAVDATLGPAADGAVRVEAGPMRATWALVDGRVGHVAAGAVEVVPVEAFADVEPPDLPSLLRLPTEPWPEAAASHHLVVRLDGVAPEDLDFPPGQVADPDGVRVERPLRHEIPEARYERVRVLMEQVRARMRVEPRPGVPDAASVLAEGAGDCNEYAAALVALLEADGMPARAVTGWAYADGAVEPGLYPHAWVEAWLGDPAGWVPVDPARGQVIADATHLRARDGVTVLARPVVTRLEIR